METAIPPTLRADGIRVAVVDGGVRIDHPDLLGQVSRLTCLPEKDLVLDLEHGTNIAGLVAPIDGDGSGLAALVPGITLIDVPVIGVDEDGNHRGSAQDIAAGIRCATAEGVDIINLSMAGSCADAGVIEEALAAAEAAGIVVVAAAGNVDLPTQPCPGVFPTVIAVAAGRADGTISAGRKWGDVVAPGFELVTASASETRQRTIVSGTSFAAPLVVAGIAALLAGHDDWTPARVRARVISAARHATILTLPQLLRDDMFAAVAVTADGLLIAIGDTSVAGHAPTHSAVGVVQPPCGGMLVAAADGGVFAYGGARFLGSLAGIALAAPVVAIASTPSGRGYWMAVADGGIFAFGDAGFHGSLGAIRIESPIVDFAVTPTGRGYWLLAADGQVYSLGDAIHRGAVSDDASTMVALSPIADGYVLTRADGLAIRFGDRSHSWSTDAEGGVVDAFISAEGLVVVTARGELISASNGRTLFQLPTVRPRRGCARTVTARSRENRTVPLNSSGSVHLDAD